MLRLIKNWLHLIQNMQGKIVGVLNQSESLLLIEKYSKIFINTYTSPSFVMEALKFDLVDAVLLDTLIAYAYVTNIYTGEFKIVTKPLNDEGIYLVTMKDQNPLFIDIYNEGIKRMKRRGIYKKLLKKWDLYPESVNQIKK